MKTTLDIHDDLLRRAKRHARRTGQPLDAIVEEGLLLVLPTAAPRGTYRLPDLSAGRTAERDPLDGSSWRELRELIFGKPKTH